MRGSKPCLTCGCSTQKQPHVHYIPPFPGYPARLSTAEFEEMFLHICRSLAHEDGADANWYDDKGIYATAHIPLPSDKTDELAARVEAERLAAPSGQRAA